MKTLLTLFLAFTIAFTIIWSYNDKEFNFYNYVLECSEKVEDLEKPQFPSFEFHSLEMPRINHIIDIGPAFNAFIEFLFQPLQLLIDILKWLFDWVMLIFGIIGIIGGGLVL